MCTASKRGWTYCFTRSQILPVINPFFHSAVVEVRLDDAELQLVLVGGEHRLFEDLDEAVPLKRREALVADRRADARLAAADDAHAAAGAVTAGSRSFRKPQPVPSSQRTALPLGDVYTWAIRA